LHRLSKQHSLESVGDGLWFVVARRSWLVRTTDARVDAGRMAAWWTEILHQRQSVFPTEINELYVLHSRREVNACTIEHHSSTHHQKKKDFAETATATAQKLITFFGTLGQW